MPTGTGKTVLFGHVAHRWNNGRVLVIAHRDELIRQAESKLQQITQEQIGIEKADERADGAGYIMPFHIVVASIQSISRPKRLERYKPNAFGLIIVDEAHHSLAETYKRVLNYFTDATGLGVTATPDRADELALGEMWKSVAFDYQLPQAIDDGYLVRIEQQYVFVDSLDLSGCKSNREDLLTEDLERIMLVEENLHRVVQPTIELAGDRKTLVFATTVAHAHRMCEIANRHRPGLAEVVSGETPDDERKEILRRYAAGDLQYLFNCMIATEGWDCPGVEVVAIARPTKSRALYTQMIGRGTRPLPGLVDGLESPEQRCEAIALSPKPSMLVLDFVGNSGRHKLVSSADVLGGIESDEIVEAAKAEVAKKSQRGEAADVKQEIEQARRVAEEELQRKQEMARRAEEAAAKRRAHVKPMAAFQTQFVDPFAKYSVVPTRGRGWDRIIPCTPAQVAWLKARNIDASKLHRRQASAIIAKGKAQEPAWECGFSPKQLPCMIKAGYSEQRLRALSKSTARKAFDLLVANKWKASTELDELIGK
jgi:superfamily II DNA or RNA helicase